MNLRYHMHNLEDYERPKHLYVYYVTGSGVFPFDMLRHDCAWPAHGEDAAKLEWERMNTDDRSRGQRSIKLYSNCEPTVTRWSSFLWSVGTEALVK